MHSHIYYVKEVLALFSPENLDIIATSPLCLAVSAYDSPRRHLGRIPRIFYVKEVLALFV